MGRLKEFDYSEYLYERLGDEAASAILAEFQIEEADENTADSVLFGLVDIVFYYDDNASFLQRVGVRKRHVDRMNQITMAARKLNRLLVEEPFGQELLRGRDKIRRRISIEDMKEALDAISAAAAAIVDNPDRLTRLRGIFDARKTPERQFVWENVFRLFETRFDKIGASGDGPIYRVIKQLHVGLGLAPPVGASIKKAILERRNIGYSTGPF